MTGALAPLDAMPREKDVYFAKLAEQAEREELSWAEKGRGCALCMEWSRSVFLQTMWPH